MLPYERTKEWRVKNKDKHAAQLRRYFLKHKEAINEYQKAYSKRKREEAKLAKENA